MSNPSAAVLVNGSPISLSGASGANVSPSSLVTIALANTSGVSNWRFSCTSNDGNNPNSAPAIINSGLTINSTAFTATFTAPAMDGYFGAAMQFTSIVNIGSYNQNVVTIGIFVLNSNGSRLVFGGESFESNATIGCADDYNKLAIIVTTGGGAPIGPASGDLFHNYPNPIVVGLQGVPVSATAPTTNQALVYNGSVWVPTTQTDVDTLAGDVTGPTGSNTVGALQGVPVSNTSPTDGYALIYSATAGKWVPLSYSTNDLNVRTVGPAGSNADYICTGTNDDIIINKAITDAYNANQSTVLMLPGTYFISNQVNLLSHIHLTSMGLGTVAIVLASNFNDSGNLGGICAIGSDTTGTAITLSADLADGYNTIQVNALAEYSLVNSEDWLSIRSTTPWESTELSGRTIAEFVRVNQVFSNHFSIYGFARSTYTTAASASLYRQTLVDSPMVSNIEMYQQAALGTRTNPHPLVNFTQAINGKVINCKLHDNDQVGVLLRFSIASIVSQCEIFQLYDNPSNNQLGYGVQLVGAENSKIENNSMYKCRHGMTTGGGSYGVARGIDFVGNTVSLCTNSCVDTHNQSEDVNISGNNCNNSISDAFFIRGRSTNVIGNSVEWCGGGVQVGLHPYQVSGGSGTGSKILGNTFRNIKVGNSITSAGSIHGSGFGCILDLTDNCIVASNTFENCDQYGIFLEQKVSNCIIERNTFLNCNLLNSANVSVIGIEAGFSTTVLSVTAFDGISVATATYTGTLFQNYYVGSTVVITGAASAGNNGSFTILSSASNTITYTNAGAVAGDANNGAITAFIENVTDNIIQNNTATNTAASIWDPNSTGGHASHFVFDSGSSVSAGSNVRNIFRYNQPFGMVTAYYNIQNPLNQYSEFPNNKYLLGRGGLGNYDLALIGAFTNDAVLVGDSTHGASVNLTSSTGTVNLQKAGSTGLAFAANPTGSTTITAVAGATAFSIKQSDLATNSGTGATATFQAQNETGTTSIGGAVVITSGTGTSAAGPVLIKTGGTTRLTANATGVITIANLGTGVVHSDSSGNLTSSAIATGDVTPGTSGQVLMSNATPATTWTTLSGDVTNALGVMTVAAVNGTTVPATPSANQLLLATGSTAASWTTTLPGNYSFSGTPTFSNPVALGSSTATTQAAGDNSTKLATTAYTDRNFYLPTVAGFRDDFINQAGPTSITTANTVYGDTVWGINTVGAGTQTWGAVDATFANPGQATMTTASAAGGDGCVLYKSARGSLGNLAAQAGWDIHIICKIGGTSTICMRAGVCKSGTQTADPPTDWFGVEFDTANTGHTDTDFTWVTRSASTPNYSTTNAIPADTSFHHYRMRSTSAGHVLFSVDGGTETDISTDVSTALMQPYVQIITRTTGADVLTLDYYSCLLATTRT